MMFWYSFRRALVKRALGYVLFVVFLLVLPIYAQDSESFFDDELPEKKEDSGDLKSKPIELKSKEEKRKEALKKTNEKGEVTLPVNEDPVKTEEERPRDERPEGPIDQVAPLSVRPKESILDNSRFLIGGDYFYNTGRGSLNLPSGWGGFLAYDVDEANNRGFDLRFEMGYLNIAKDAARIDGYYFEAGIAWILKFKSMPFQLTTAILPGVGYFAIKDASFAATAVKMTAHAAVGMEFPMMMKKLERTDEIIPFIQLRGGYVYDTALPIVHYGLYAGFAYKFGAVNVGKY